MKQVVTSSEMKKLDLLAAKKFSIPLILLMESAGAEIARNVVEYVRNKNIINPKILIVAGPGNNGGDGIVTARHFLNLFDKTSVLLVILTKGSYQGDSKINYEIIKRITRIDNRIKIIENKFDGAKNFNPDIIVDAVFGTGFKGAPQGIYKQVIEMMNKLSGYKVAVDIPSGVNGDNGLVEGLVVKSDLTITMGLLKRGHLLYPGKEYCGDVKIANLGVSYESLRDAFNTFLLDQEFVKENLPKRKPNGHKGTCGSVRVVAGGKGYSGAACLTSLGALSSGAGLVRLCYPISINTAVEKKLTEVIKVPLPATSEDTLALISFYKIKEVAQQSTVIAIGPGITTDPETKELTQKIITTINLPTVIDADGLNNLTLAHLYKIPKRRRLNTVLTPHPGEFERLFKVNVEKMTSPSPGPSPSRGEDKGEGETKGRIDICREWAKKLSLTIVLKGAPTVIGDYSGNIFINPTGNSGLAKGGSGDVLTGMIAGFIAQGASPLIAACIGVYLHGYAADLAVKDKTEYSLVATDLIKTLPKAIQKITTDGHR